MWVGGCGCGVKCAQICIDHRLCHTCVLYVFITGYDVVQCAHVYFVRMYYNDTANMCTDLIGLIDISPSFNECLHDIKMFFNT